ncbi:MAG: GNAT family N-acetyltransferase [Clostridia bacterium]|nr:GNAT family N-acetyltransferase [Clostridia bacterium]
MELVKLDKSEFDSFYNEIINAFIYDEYREYKEAKKLFFDGSYDIFCLKNNDTYIGFISIWHFSDFYFAEHFVVKEEFRSKGYGMRILAAIKEFLPKIVLEAEPPISELQMRRIGFYKRNGFIENEGEYYQPAYKEGSNQVRLLIMSYPDKLSNFNTVCEQIKRKVYSNR